MAFYFAEYIGTLILLLFGGGVVANVVLKDSKGFGGGWIVIATGWGLGVAMAVYAVGRVSGAHINPAVTLGLASIGEFPWTRVPGYIIAQTAGAFSGATLVWIAYFPHFETTEDAGLKRAIFCTSPGIRLTWSNFTTEFLGTAVLVFLVLSLGSVARGVNPLDLNEGLKIGFSTWFGPLLVGMLVVAIGLSLGGPTGYAINPARDLGPRLAHALLPVAGKGGSDWSYAWVPVLAPALGGIAGARLFVWTGF